MANWNTLYVQPTVCQLDHNVTQYPWHNVAQQSKGVRKGCGPFRFAFRRKSQNCPVVEQIQSEQSMPKGNPVVEDMIYIETGVGAEYSRKHT